MIKKVIIENANLSTVGAGLLWADRYLAEHPEITDVTEVSVEATLFTRSFSRAITFTASIHGSEVA